MPMPDIRERLLWILTRELTEDPHARSCEEMAYEGIVDVGGLADTMIKKLGLTRFDCAGEHWWATDIYAND